MEQTQEAKEPEKEVKKESKEENKNEDKIEINDAIATKATEEEKASNDNNEV